MTQDAMRVATEALDALFDLGRFDNGIIGKCGEDRGVEYAIHLRTVIGNYIQAAHQSREAEVQALKDEIARLSGQREKDEV